MKRIFQSSCCMFWFVLLLRAQTNADHSGLQIVGKPEKSSTEIVGVKDASGRFCAAVQVVSDMDGFSYTSNNGVVRVDDQPGKDMVFVSPDERELEIYHAGYKPLQVILSEIGIQLHEKEVWKIEIKGQSPSASTLPVSILVQPEDAAVEIDGKPAGAGPVFQLSRGEHRIRILKSGFQPLEQTKVVDEKNVLFRFTLKEKQDIGVQITSTPEGAIVYLDNLKIGTTPAAVFYPEGSYRIRVEKEGYVTTEEEFKVAPPSVQKNFILEENVGFITINTDAKATLYLNGQATTQRMNIKLAPSVIQVKVTLPKAEPIEKQVILKRNDRVVLDMHPVVPKGTIQVAVAPFDAIVELTGDAGESFTSTGMKVFTEIPVGTYRLKASRTGYTDYTETLTLASGQKLTKNVKLIEKAASVSSTSGAQRMAGGSSGPLEMASIKGGTFRMGDTFGEGDSDEKPVHTVTVSDFYLSKYEVTVAQYRAFCNATGRSMPKAPSWGWQEDHPIVNVNWNDAVAFCKHYGYRLPTEAEWEYAAKGGDKSQGYMYSGSNTVVDVAWNNENSGNQTHTVGTKIANELGLYDMSGNVWEWCQDWYGKKYYESSPSTNPQGPDTGTDRVLRGGSWHSYRGSNDVPTATGAIRAAGTATTADFVPPGEFL